MKITKENIKDGVLIRLEGRLDTSTSDELDAAVKALDKNLKVLEFDFSNLEYISSSGLRVLLATQKMISAKNGSMCIKNANKVVKEVFDITGFSSFIKLI